jgi:hypothetical protein
MFLLREHRSEFEETPARCNYLMPLRRAVIDLVVGINED